MIDAGVRRVIWKEYRLQRTLWLAIAAATVVLQLLLLVSAALMNQPAEPYPLFSLAMAMPLFYALGSGAMLFAGEREAETYEFQRCLPVSAGRVAAGKLAYALSSAVALLLLGWLTAWVFAAGKLPKPADHFWLWVGHTVVLLEVLGWTVFFSLLLRSVLWAAILGPLAAVLFGVVVVPLSLAGIWERLGGPLNDYGAGLPGQLVLTLLIWAANIGLARSWFAEQTLRNWLAAAADTHAARRTAATRARGGGGMAFAYLLWHAGRQMRGTLAALLLGTAALALWTMVMMYRGMPRPDEPAPLLVPWYLLPLLAALLGSSLFWSDQRAASFRYFAERGIAPRWVWFSRHAIALSVLLGWAVLAIGCLGLDALRAGSDFQLRMEADSATRGAFGDGDAYVISRDAVETLVAVSGLAVLSYAVGQLCSLVISRGVVALFAGLLASVLVGLWAALMRFAGVPLWFSVLPIPLVLVGAAWLRAPDWILEQTTWRSRWKLIGSVAVPLTAVAMAVAVFRVREIPPVAPQLLAGPVAVVQRQPDREAVETALLYGQAAAAVRAAETLATLGLVDARSAGASPEGADSAPVMGGDSAGMSAMEPEDVATEIVRQRSSALERLREAASRDECWFPGVYETAGGAAGEIPDHLIRRAHQAALDLPQLTRVALEEAARLQRDGQLDEAWPLYLDLLQAVRRLHQRADWSQQRSADRMEAAILARLPQWVAAPGQTAERIERALQQLDHEHLGWLPPRLSAVAHEYLIAREVLDFSPAVWKAMGAGPRELQTARAAAVLMPWELARSQRLVNAAAERQQRWVQSWMLSLDPERRSLSQAPPWEAQIEAWRQSTIAKLPGGPSTSWMHQVALRQRAHRRVAQLQFLLAIHYHRHGALPQRLEDAVPESSRSVTTDPYTRQPFWYRPAGIAERIRRSQPTAAFDATGHAQQVGASGRPVIWSDVPAVSMAEVWPELRSPGEALEAGTPFLWCAGPALGHTLIVQTSAEGARPAEPSIVNFVYRDGITPPRQIVAEEELWRFGWCIPLPVPPAEPN